MSLTLERWEYAPELLSQRLGMAGDDSDTADGTNSDSEGADTLFARVMGDIIQCGDATSSPATVPQALNHLGSDDVMINGVYAVLMLGKAEGDLIDGEDDGLLVATDGVMSEDLWINRQWLYQLDRSERIG